MLCVFVCVGLLECRSLEKEFPLPALVSLFFGFFLLLAQFASRHETADDRLENNNLSQSLSLWFRHFVLVMMMMFVSSSLLLVSPVIPGITMTAAPASHHVDCKNKSYLLLALSARTIVFLSCTVSPCLVTSCPESHFAKT